MLKLIKHISNIKDAFRVLEIMDHAGAMIEIPIYANDDVTGTYRGIICPYYVTEQEANDLVMICQNKRHYKPESKLFHKIFYRNIGLGYRDFYYHSGGEK